MRSPTCRAVRALLPSLDDPDTLRGPPAAHLGVCLRCQAEAARYRRLRRSLAALPERVEQAPAGLVGEVAQRLGEADPEASNAPVRAARVAAAAGAVVAAAGTVAMVRWMRARSAA